jgi:hypothetical protein
MTAMGQTVRFMGSEDFSKLWADAEELVDRLMATPRQQ